jgi:hypothetical protein
MDEVRYGTPKKVPPFRPDIPYSLIWRKYDLMQCIQAYGDDNKPPPLLEEEYPTVQERIYDAERTYLCMLGSPSYEYVNNMLIERHLIPYGILKKEWIDYEN